jgi:hypothetical protein
LFKEKKKLSTPSAWRMSVGQDGQERVVAKVEISLVCERCRKFCLVISSLLGILLSDAVK